MSRRSSSSSWLAGLLLLGLGGPAAAETFEAAIAKYRFEPAELSIRPGDTVRWVNREARTSHSLVIRGQESPRLFPGESWEYRFDEAGRYEYFCGPHPEMKGVVVVAE